MPADRSPIREAVLDGKGPRAYALISTPDRAGLEIAGLEIAADAARRFRFDSMLAAFATAGDPGMSLLDDSALNMFARSAHDQGLLAWAQVSLDLIRSDHDLVASAGAGVFGAPRASAVRVVDPRLAVGRAIDAVRLRRADAPGVLTWWRAALARLRELGFDGFVLVEPRLAGETLAGALREDGYRLELFHRPAMNPRVQGRNYFVETAAAETETDGGAEPLHQVLAYLALHAGGWAVTAAETDVARDTLTWMNQLPLSLDCAAESRAWTGAGAPLQIVSRRVRAGALVAVHNAGTAAQAWPPQVVPAMPWQEFRAAPGYTLPDQWISPGDTVLLEAQAQQAVVAASPLDLRSATSPARRVIITEISPSIDNGAYAVKAVIGDRVHVSASIFCDGHEQLAAAVHVRTADAPTWTAFDMAAVGNDVWQAEMPVTRLGRHEFRIEAWLDIWGGYTRDLRRKRDAGQTLDLEILEGGALIDDVAKSAGTAAPMLAAASTEIRSVKAEQAVELLLADSLAALMRASSERHFLTRSYAQLLEVEREAARFASWYELFPRSQTQNSSQHGTFHDVVARLPHIAGMGFDTLYFPPIHPIGERNRKGRNNALTAAPDDFGSPYAIGSTEGGHDAIHPELGTLADFQALIVAAAEFGLEIALDFAIQCAPDHPWLGEHPDWFAWRPDGSIKYAENPPKKYQDIVNVAFYAAAAVPDLWSALRDVVLFWVEQGVRTFRVDNPHTKPLPFWEWMIGDVKARHPDVIFLSEAFTRPRPMYHLAKVGFSQSYTYFTWRNTKPELTEYITELTQTEVRDYFRPHFFVNTPDINPIFLQNSGRAGFLIRAALATTLSGLWGMYSGFELCESAPLPGREEYLDSEKYELRPRPDRRAGDIVDEITHLNRLRRAEPALQTHLGVSFHNAFNDNVLYYSKSVPGYRDSLLIAVNLDPFGVQDADFDVPLWLFELPDSATVDVEDLLSGSRFQWTGKMQRMRLSPERPYAIWRIMRPAGADANV